jgi:putative transposase
MEWISVPVGSPDPTEEMSGSGEPDLPRREKTLYWVAAGLPTCDSGSGGKNMTATKKIKHYDNLGHAHFITLIVNQHTPIFKGKFLCEIVVSALIFYRDKLNFRIWGYVIMPDHIHMVISFADNEERVIEFIRDFKKFVSKKVVEILKPEDKKAFLLDSPKKRNHRYQIWQKDFYDFNIFNEETLREKLNYIHYNPVRKGLADSPENYIYSSYRQYYVEESSLIR